MRSTKEEGGLRILLVHNHYGLAAPSGENRVFELERDLLIRNGHEVETFERHSDELRARGSMGLVSGALMTPWNFSAAREVHDAVQRFRPEVVHAHNTFPMLSPSVFVGARGTARVLTLHNYRLVCPAAIPMRNGQVCTDCMDTRSTWPALRHGCYRDSRLATVPLATSVMLHRWLGTWVKNVDAFIALSDFQKEVMSASGLSADHVHVKPNFYQGSPAVVPMLDREPYVVYVGRLTAEKGMETLLRAWRAWGQDAPELRLLGDGGLRKKLEQMTANLPVRFLGQVSSEEAQVQIARARMLVLPSEWFETFGLVVVEALAHGTPAAVSKIGALPSIVKHGSNGVVFSPANPESLLQEVRTAWETPGALEYMGQGARSEFEERYTEDVNYRMLMDIYEDAIATNQGRKQA